MPDVDEVVNVAATCRSTRSLGPGLRFAVWVQGCPLRCPGCMAPEWIPDIPARLVTPMVLADEILSDPRIEGLTLSGGEPMNQASGLARTVRLARTARDLTVICFTGYRLARLRERPPHPGVPDLLAEIDVLVDGPYRVGLDDGRGLRGSTNQHVHHLTDRLRSFNFATAPRSAEIRIGLTQAVMVGVPPHNLLERVGDITRRLQRPTPRADHRQHDGRMQA